MSRRMSLPSLVSRGDYNNNTRTNNGVCCRNYDWYDGNLL